MFSIGDTLLEAREKQGQSLKDAEKETKIRVKYLEALEQNKFDLIPGDAYVKIFIREYSHFLNLDPDPLVREYKEKFEVAPQYEKLAPVNMNVDEKPYRKALVVFFILVLFVAGGFFIWQSGLLKGQEEKAAVTGKTKRQEDTSKKKSPKDPQSQKNQSNDASVGTVPSQDKFTVKVTVIGEEGSLIQARVDGGESFDAYVGAGQVREWSAQEKVELFVGTPKAVQVEKDGVLDTEISQAKKPISKVISR